eukprot:GHUV01031939.1.p1 GENE.GHUV01031939.1~~GHUV01031939.1.p1  ORF type:complete len:358 (+),score=97.96 GHUV01031939.1:187-1260(+)
MSLYQWTPLILNGNIAACAPAVLRVLDHLTTLQLSSSSGAASGTLLSSVRSRAAATSGSKQPGQLQTARHLVTVLAFNPQTRGFSASACGTAECGTETTTLPDLISKVEGFVGVKETDTAVLAQLAESAMARASELSPEQIRNLCMSFAQLGYFNTQFKSIMADVIMDKIGQFKPAVLADTAWAFGEANYYDYDLMSTLLPYLKTNIEQFDASSMAKMLWTFGRFGYQDETLMDMMHDIAIKLQANCNSKSLAEVVYAMAQLGWADIRLHNLVADYAMDNIQDFDTCGLAKLAYGLAAVGYDDDELYTAITTAAAAGLDSMSPNEVSMILWACGEQGHMCDRFMSGKGQQSGGLWGH